MADLLHKSHFFQIFCEGPIRWGPTQYNLCKVGTPVVVVVVIAQHLFSCHLSSPDVRIIISVNCFKNSL